MMAWLRISSTYQTGIGSKTKSKCIWKTRMLCKTLSTVLSSKRRPFSSESISRGLSGLLLNTISEHRRGHRVNSQKIKTLLKSSTRGWQSLTRMSRSAKMKTHSCIRIHRKLPFIVVNRSLERKLRSNLDPSHELNFQAGLLTLSKTANYQRLAVHNGLKGSTTKESTSNWFHMKMHTI